MSFLNLLKLYGRQSKPKPVRRREILDLGELRDDRVYYWKGDNLSVIALTAAAVATMRFDQPDALVNVLVQGHSWPLLPFNRLYFSNAIQIGSFVTVEFDFYGFDSDELATEALQSLNELANDLKINALRLMDAGTRINSFAEYNGPANVVLYTCPPGCVFYLLSYDMNGIPLNSAVAIEAGMFYAVLNDINHLDGAAGCLYMHCQNAFTNVRLVAGDLINTWADANTHGAFVIQGVEVHA